MEKNNKDLKKGLILILVAIIGYWAINNLDIIGNVFKTIFSILFPFILGGCLAFILNIPMTFFEKKFSKIKKINNKQQKNKGLRIVSIIFAIIVIVLVLALVIRLIVPELIEVVKVLIDNIPYCIEELTNFIENHVDGTLDINSMIQGIDTEEIKNQIMSFIPNVVTSSISIVGGIVGGISKFIIALIFAIYILIDKEKLKKQATKVLHAYLSTEKANKIVSIGSITSDIFKKFFTVQCLEATILGTLCVIGMLILRIPYAVPIGVLIGVTALIPIVGAFIGVIVGAILIVAVNPVKVIVFVLFVLILQQIEGNLIYPRVVGNSLGLPGMWVLFAVTIGGGLGGILGMLVSVPIATVFYTLIKKDVNKKINNRKLVKS